jgi:thiol-disulfide isomerase/thioredoxin
MGRLSRRELRFRDPSRRAVLVRRVLTVVLWLAAASAAAAYFAQGYLARVTPPAPDKPVSTMPRSAPVTSTAFNVLDEPRSLPDLHFADGAGRAVRLSDFRGRTVLLNLWATWCGPCRQEMPALDRLQAELGGPGFRVIALSTDAQGVAAVHKFYREVGVERLGVYVDPAHEDMGELGLIGLPTTLLIDPRGREIGRKLGRTEWDSAQMMALIEGYLGRVPVAGSGSAGGD